MTDHSAMSKTIPIQVGRKRYSSIQELADAYSLPYATLRHRILKQGLPPKEAVSKPIQKHKRVPVEAFGKRYPSLSAAARAYDKNSEVVRNKVRYGMTLENALLGHDGLKQTVTAFGVTYASRTEAAEAFGLSKATFSGRLRGGWDIEEALIKPPHEVGTIEVAGTQYKSIAELARQFNLPYNLARKRIRVFGWTADDAVTLPKKTGRKITIRDKAFPSIAAAALEVGIDPRLVRYRISAGWTIERSLDPNAEVENRRSVVIDDEFFPTFSDAARTYKLKEVTFMKRLRVGWSPEQAAGLLPPPTFRKGTHRVSPKEYRKRLKEIHGDSLDFSHAHFERAQDDVEVICTAGKPHAPFFATPNNLLGGKGCPICKLSHGGKRIARWLERYQFEYKTEWTEHDLRSKTYKRAVLRFDFLLPAQKTLIEYDGEQHFFPVRFGNQSKKQAQSAFEQTKRNDRRKNNWAKKHGYQLIRIKFNKTPSEVLKKHLLPGR
jgi:hypothetical protein